jgi:hypothetical protein
MTNSKAPFTGGVYLVLSSKFENNKFLLISIICISSIFLINFWVFKNLEYSFGSSFKKLALLFVSKAINIISDLTLSCNSAT